ncbi:DUF1648 domain-containing protein [Planococcus sp. CAU13]|uniref:DUF1648 domain-containing protein n=1 Tax=Planococcus sp. CAU13 TaxID=1541197 RepID=UPI00052FEC7A|nr:DUF1648 domain-containing protein [Planococcus sp. CAU13]
MKKQPVIKMGKPLLAKFLDAVTVIIFLAAIIYLIVQFPVLPEQVPAHYDATGSVDRWGSKMEMLILPAVGIGLWILMTILERHPHLLNYLNLREDNIEAQYRNGVLMMNVLKNECVLLFSYLIFQGVWMATEDVQQIDNWILPIFLVVIFGSMIIFIIRMLRA